METGTDITISEESVLGLPSGTVDLREAVLVPDEESLREVDSPFPDRVVTLGYQLLSPGSGHSPWRLTLPGEWQRGTFIPKPDAAQSDYPGMPLAVIPGREGRFSLSLDGHRFNSYRFGSLGSLRVLAAQDLSPVRAIETMFRHPGSVFSTHTLLRQEVDVPPEPVSHAISQGVWGELTQLFGMTVMLRVGGRNPIREFSDGLLYFSKGIFGKALYFRRGQEGDQLHYELLPSAPETDPWVVVTGKGRVFGLVVNGNETLLSPMWPWIFDGDPAHPSYRARQNPNLQLSLKEDRMRMTLPLDAASDLLGGDLLAVGPSFLKFQLSDGSLLEIGTQATKPEKLLAALADGTPIVGRNSFGAMQTRIWEQGSSYFSWLLEYGGGQSPWQLRALGTTFLGQTYPFHLDRETRSKWRLAPAPVPVPNDAVKAPSSVSPVQSLTLQPLGFEKIPLRFGPYAAINQLTLGGVPLRVRIAPGLNVSDTGGRDSTLYLRMEVAALGGSPAYAVLVLRVTPDARSIVYVGSQPDSPAPFVSLTPLLEVLDNDCYRLTLVLPEKAGDLPWGNGDRRLCFHFRITTTRLAVSMVTVGGDQRTIDLNGMEVDFMRWQDHQSAIVPGKILRSPMATPRVATVSPITPATSTQSQLVYEPLTVTQTGPHLFSTPISDLLFGPYAAINKFMFREVPLRVRIAPGFRMVIPGMKGEDSTLYLCIEFAALSGDPAYAIILLRMTPTTHSMIYVGYRPETHNDDNKESKLSPLTPVLESLGDGLFRVSVTLPEDAENLLWRGPWSSKRRKLQILLKMGPGTVEIPSITVGENRITFELDRMTLNRAQWLNPNGSVASKKILEAPTAPVRSATVVRLGSKGGTISSPSRTRGSRSPNNTVIPASRKNLSSEGPERAASRGHYTLGGDSQAETDRKREQAMGQIYLDDSGAARAAEPSPAWDEIAGEEDPPIVDADRLGLGALSLQKIANEFWENPLRFCVLGGLPGNGALLQQAGRTPSLVR